ncbi:MAG: LemA family protein [Algisphaera sp.]
MPVQLFFAVPTLALLGAAGVVTIVLLVLLLAAALWAVGIFNRLVSLRNRYQNAFAQIDVQLKRRYDLIPNLVETAKAYLGHERNTLEAVMQARATATQAQVHVAGDPTDTASMARLQQADGALTASLGRLLAVAENYPDLKADQTMMQLSEELTTTENKVAFSRQAYNDGVLNYKNYRESFPPVILANILGFGDAAYFELEEASQKDPPKVDFAASAGQ